MQRTTSVSVIGIAAILLVGGYTLQGRPDYTASGALAGGATGAVIGSMAGRRGPGAIVCGAVGAIVGGLIGHGLDPSQEAQLRAQAPQTIQRGEEGQPLMVPDVEALARAWISDDLIISQIRNSRTVYHLSTAEIIDLKNAGISERVIDFMINTQTQIDAAHVGGVVGSTPPAPLPETIDEAPGPDYVWVGGTWVWLGDHWGWHHGYWHQPVYPHRRWKGTRRKKMKGFEKMRGAELPKQTQTGRKSGACWLWAAAVCIAAGATLYGAGMPRYLSLPPARARQRFRPPCRCRRCLPLQATSASTSPGWARLPRSIP
ncbi:MAG: hypothetical protein KQI81_12605 [Deltaproteobacteria bacterium]|nr:hypothetical protein [Deltaproteobacteria bacterium]